jgi:hypothetical protein
MFGDAEYSHAGSYLTRVRARKRTWNVETPWLKPTDASAVGAALAGTPPHAATGTLTGTLYVVVEMAAEETITVNGVTLKRFVFQLVEA